MRQLLQMMGVISTLVLASVGGFWLMESRAERAKVPSKVSAQLALAAPVEGAKIRKHIALVRALRPRMIRRWQNEQVENVAFSPDGRWLARSTEGGIEIVGAKSWKRFRLLKDVGGAFAFSNDSKSLAAQYSGVWRLSDGRRTHNVGGGNVLLGPVSFSPDDKFVATLKWPDSVTTRGPSIYPAWIAKDLEVWDLSRAAPPKTQRGLASDDHGFSTIIWRNRAKVGQVAIWKAELLSGHGAATRVARHAIAVNLSNRFLEARNATTGELLSRARRPGKIGPLAIAPDATIFAGADAADPLIYLWRLPDGKLLDTIKLAGGQKAVGLAFSSDARQLAVSALKVGSQSRAGATTIYQLNKTPAKSARNRK